MWSLLPKDLTNQNLFTFTAAGVVHHYSADYIICSYGTIECILVIVKPMAGVAHIITGHEQTQPVCYFHFFDVVLALQRI